jgi:hypothetical protein
MSKHDIRIRIRIFIFPSCPVSESALVCGIVCINKFGLMGDSAGFAGGWRRGGVKWSPVFIRK